MPAWRKPITCRRRSSCAAAGSLRMSTCFMSPTWGEPTWPQDRPGRINKRRKPRSREDAAMYVTLRRYAEVGVRMYQIVARNVEEGLLPMLKCQPGFRCYCAFVSEDG